MKESLETNRLRIRPFTLEDAQDIFEIAGNPKVNQYMMYSQYKNLEEVKEWIGKVEGKSRKLVFEKKNCGKVIGIGSIKFKNNRQAYELEYSINNKFWNQGYATEASKALIKWANQNMGARKFFASHASGNLASARVLEKCGFSFLKNSHYQTFDNTKKFSSRIYQLILK